MFGVLFDPFRNGVLCLISGRYIQYFFESARQRNCIAMKKRSRREPAKMGSSLVVKYSTHRGFCWTFPLYRPSRPLEQFRTQGFLRIQSTAVQTCAGKSTELASGSKIVGENRREMENSLLKQDSMHRGSCNGKSLSWMGLARERWCCTRGLLSGLDMNTCQTSIKTDILL